MLDYPGIIIAGYFQTPPEIVLMENNAKRQPYLIEIEGIVQGVGFRPFIYKLAQRSGIKGTVANTTEGVVIRTCSLSGEELASFIESIRNERPPASVIERINTSPIISPEFDSFKIEKSCDTGNHFQLVSPDLATCDKCNQDILNRDDRRRYHYAFTNCTNCGPRFTIIKKMPYDRSNTTMDLFRMCPDCQKEYLDQYDRRFHAQPNACAICGPRLVLIDNNGKTVKASDPIKAASGLLRKGYLVGIKSLGGFQIACDALSDAPLIELRSRKSRPSKPFAVMACDLEWVRTYYHLDPVEAASLKSPRAPIVLLRKKGGSYPLSPHVSLNNRYEGIMLPYTPIHHILFEYMQSPLVMTSGNISEEPIAADNADARERLDRICDYYLMHNRDIYSRYDDSVIRVFKGNEMILRRARGYAPYPVKLVQDADSMVILATGAQEKNTFTILTRNYGLTSQHIGDLDSVQSRKFFESCLDNYKTLFGIEDFDLVAHDIHPDYSSTRTAHNLAGKYERLFPVQHHKAHISSVIAENGLEPDLIGFSWDGTGYGEDEKIWGSEIFMVGAGLDFTRIGHLSEKSLPGGVITIKRPYRMTAVYLYQLFYGNSAERSVLADNILENMTYKDIDEIETGIIIDQIRTGFNSPVTTSMGRFFDAVSSLLDLIHVATYEGEAAIALEMSIDDKYIDLFKKTSSTAIDSGYRYEILLDANNDKYIIDDIDIFRQVLDDVKNGVDKGFIAFKFHNTLAQIILNISIENRKKTGTVKVALSGGVFQNNYLLDMCYTLLGNNGFDVYTNLKVPVNDGGISLGQAYMAAIRKGLFKKGDK